MTTDPPGGSSDPFASQTQINTGSQDWLDGYQKISADFGSLNGYARNMFTAAMDLQPAAMPLYKIPQLINTGFRGQMAFPEAQLAALFVSTNFKDLITMLNDLHIGMQNMSFAAQTISDAYHLSDDGSAHDLNTLITVDGVDFAFGRGGARPEGLDKKIGETWAQQSASATVNQASANAAAVSNASDPSSMGGTISTSYVGPPDHQTKVTTITYADGSQIQIDQTVDYTGTTWTTTSVLGADGKVQTSSRQVRSVSGSTTTVVNQTATNGIYSDSSKQVTTTSVAIDGTKTTTTASSTPDGGKWAPSGTTTKTDNPDGSTQTTTTTVSTDTRGKTTTNTSTVAIGDNDGDISDQKAYDPKDAADKRYTTFTHMTSS